MVIDRFNQHCIAEITAKLEELAADTDAQKAQMNIFLVWAYLTQDNHYRIEMTEQYRKEVDAQVKKDLQTAAKEEPVP